MPDAIASYSAGGQTYLVTANEGDAREYNGLTEVLRLGAAGYVLDPVVFPNAAALKVPLNLGRLNVTNASGDTDGDGDFDEIHTFGSRSFSIWNASTGALVWDSGDDLELITSKHPVYGPLFNASNANNTLKNRSDDKGPEPEGVTVAQIFGRTFAFVALERIGGCMVYDITDPTSPIYVDYKNTRTIGAYGGDNGSEGIIYISRQNSPTGLPLIILANEVSSTLSFFTVNTSVLDVTLAGIKAQNRGNRNTVSWATASEDRGDIFEMERSKNGTAFEFVKMIQANGSPSAYTFIDEQPYAGITYYRLKLKHTSGSVTYSPIVNASMKEPQKLVQVYPNPAKNKLTINTGNQEWANRIVEIIDMSGIVVKRVRLTAPQTTIDIQSLPAGIYTVNCFDGKMVQSIKITKE